MDSKEFDYRNNELRKVLINEIMRLVPAGKSHVFRIRPCALDYERVKACGGRGDGIFVEYLAEINNHNLPDEVADEINVKFHVICGGEDEDDMVYTCFQPNQLQDFVIALEKELRVMKLEELRDIIADNIGCVIECDGSFGFHSVDEDGYEGMEISYIKRVYLGGDGKVRFDCVCDGMDCLECEDNIPVEDFDLDWLISRIKGFVKPNLSLTEEQLEVLERYNKALVDLGLAGIGVVCDRDTNKEYFYNASNIEEVGVRYSDEEVPYGWFEVDGDMLDSMISVDTSFYFHRDNKEKLVMMKK